MGISVFLADDNLLVRAGVKAIIELASDLEVVGEANDFDELVQGAIETGPQVIVTDIRMPPGFKREGIEAAKLVRKHHPGTAVVILSQYDDPDYAVSLLSDGGAGCGYLLKDRVADGDQLVDAIRKVATGGSALDPRIVEALTHPLRSSGLLTTREEELLDQMAAGAAIKSIARAAGTTPADANAQIEHLFLRLARGLSAGDRSALDRLRGLQRAIADRKEQGDRLSRFLPPAVVDMLGGEGRAVGESEEREVTVLISDIRGYSGIAERVDPTTLAGQLNRHRAEMGRAITNRGGTVMQFVGDSVMGVFGAPEHLDDHPDRAVAAAMAMHQAQADVNTAWAEQDLEPFELGIGVSTGVVAALMIGSEDRVEYTVIGDTVNLAQRLQAWGRPGETVLAEATHAALSDPPEVDVLDPATVKGRVKPVAAFRFPRREAPGRVVRSPAGPPAGPQAGSPARDRGRPGRLPW